MAMSERIDAIRESIQDPTDPKYLKFCLYGEYGSWKTTTACSLPFRKAALVVTDQNWRTLENKEELFEKIDIIPYQGLSQLDTLAEMTDEYDCFILDTISQMQEEYIDFLLDNTNYGGKYREKLQPRKGISHKDAEEMGISDLEITGQQDYHVTKNKMRMPLRKLIKAPVDVVFICHVRYPSPLENIPLLRPSLTESVFKIIARECQLIGYALKKNKSESATIQFASTGTVTAKSQIGSLNDKTINAQELPKYIKEWKND